MGDIGAVATLLDRIASWVLSEDGYGDFKIRRDVARAKRAAIEAVRQGDWAATRERIAELERLSQRP